MNSDESLAFLVEHCRSVKIFGGFDPDKSSFSTAKPGDSPFKGIKKAKPSRPLDHADMGLFHIELESREYDQVHITAPSLVEAIQKAVESVRRSIQDEVG